MLSAVARRAVARRLEAQGVRIHGFDDGVLVPPRALHTGKGTPYTVFTAYKKRWDVWMDDLQPEVASHVMCMCM